MRAFIVVALVFNAAIAAAQTRDLRPSAGAATGTISGVVISDDVDARAVRKARVTCSGPGGGSTTITDESGRFVFTTLPAGRYTIGASKPTWVPTAYGARRVNRPGTPVPLAAGQALQLVVRMARGAVITGAILDYDNQPASGAQVRALRYQITGGERRLVEAGAATTDDRGVYRIYGLAAGDYYVTASTRNLGGMGAGDLMLTSDADVRDASGQAPPRAAAEIARTVALAPAFYPGGSSVTQASVIPLRPGEERTGVDFAMPLVRTAIVEGTVTLPEGGLPPGAEITLSAAPPAVPGRPADNFRRSFPGADGAFSFNAVPPGTYTLVARGSRPITAPDGSPAAAQMVWASMPLAVDGEPVTGLALSLEPGSSIVGRVRFAPSAIAPPALTSVRISALPVDTQGALSFAPASVPAGADGAFTITGVIPGRYRLNATFPGAGRTGGWTLASIAANGADALDAPLTIAPRQHVLDALVTFTDHLAQVSGMLRASSGSAVDQTVVLFPEDQSLWLPQSRRLQGVPVAADGAYAFRGVPAGRYLVAIADDAEPGEWFDPAFLQRLISSAVRVTVTGTDPVTVDVQRQ